MIQSASFASAVLATLFVFAQNAHAQTESGRQPHSSNPIIPGYYADPSILTCGGRHYIYATIDPWGGEKLGCWESADFKNWTFRDLNWPTKKACTSAASKPNMLWAPSVVRSPNGKLYMYVSCGSEIWVGSADHPLGPWKDSHGGTPLVPAEYKPGFHMIDAEAFIDTDGQSYLYWGSGLNWVNGKCWAVKLQPDMVSFDGDVKDVTPAHYFEAPFMLKHKGQYYLMSSFGKTIEDTYQIRYAIGNSPLGPFTEAATSPILVTNKDHNIISPGHHAVFNHDERHYILYHRHSIPFDPNSIGRQLCMDEMNFQPDGLIAKVTPTHNGPDFIRGREYAKTNLADPAKGAKAGASSQRNSHTGAECVMDDNYATLWAAAPGVRTAWLALDLGQVRAFQKQEIRFEYAWKSYHFLLEISADGKQWTRLADYTQEPATGSPVTITKAAKARYLKMTFPAIENGVEPALFEWVVQ